MDVRRIGSLLARGVGLRCPRCGAPTLFRGPFSMYPDCVNCGLTFEREQGYFVGAIYINYAATALIVITGYFSLDYLLKPALWQQLALWSTVGICFPLFFFRYSRSLWLALDYLFNPDDPPAPRR